MAAVIKVCVCANKYQDEKYGKNLRVMNDYKGGHRCTVCSKEHLVVSSK